MTKQDKTMSLLIITYVYLFYDWMKKQDDYDHPLLP